MLMGTNLRKFVLTLHVTLSVGWIGAVAAYMVLDITVATSQDVQTLRAAYIAMDSITQWSIVPLAWAALLTGLVISLGTKWGLFRHYWVIISLVMTVLAVGVLMIETQVISVYATVAANPTTPDDEIRGLGNTLFHSIGGTVVLLVVLVLNMYKPRGMTRYGRRMQQKSPNMSQP